MLHRFWNQIVELPEGSVWRDVMLDNLATQANPKSWSGQVAAFLSGIGLCSGPLQLDALASEQVLQHILARYDNVWAPLAHLPRVASEQVQLVTYHA